MNWACSNPTKFSSRLPSEHTRHTRRSIAVLGAPATGAAKLATQLQAALSRHPDLEVTAPDAPSAEHALVLLMGLSTPTLSTKARAEQHQADVQLRTRLQVLAVPFRVVYGDGAELLNNALLALGLSADQATQAQREGAQFALNRGRTPWSCEKCSDPDCEHRLFTGLLTHR